MKPLYATILILLVSLAARSQKVDDCYINSKTGDTVYTTYWETLVQTETCLLNFRLVRINRTFSMELKFNFGDSPDFSIAKGDSVWIKFTDGMNLPFYSVDQVESQRGLSAFEGSFKGLTTQGIYARYPLTYFQIVIFQSQLVDKIRIYSSRGFDNVILPKSKRDVISDCATLISRRVEQYQIRSGSTPEQNKAIEEQKKPDW